MIDIHKEVLVNNDAEYVQLFSYLADFSPEKYENAIGVEFPYTNGMYQTDLDDSDLTDEQLDEIESLDVDFTTFRKTEYHNFPESYPCVVCLWHVKGWSRAGDEEIFNIHVVYPSHFEGGK